MLVGESGDFLVPFLGELDFDRWHHRPLLRHPVGQHDDLLPVEKEEHAVVDSLGLCPELVNIVAEVVGVWPPELVTAGPEQLHLGDALHPRVLRQTLEPIEQDGGGNALPLRDVFAQLPFAALLISE